MQLDVAAMLPQLVGLFILIFVGYFAVKSGLLSMAMSGQMAKLLLNICLPCTVFTSLVTREYDPAFLVDGGLSILLGFIAMLAALYGGRLLARIFRVRKDGRGVWAFCATFPNNGFMGLPVVLSLLGSDALILAVMLCIPFNILAYSLGAKEICRDSAASAGRLQWKSVLISAINISIVLSLIFYLCRIPVPQVVLVPLQHLANVTTPLSMMVTGMALAGGKMSEMVHDRDAYTCCLVRLLIYPVILLFVLRLVPFSNPLIPATAVITFAMPGPAITTILTETYHGNTALGAKIVFLSSLLCIATIPVVAMLL